MYNNINYVAPNYVRKILDMKITRKEVAKIIGISDGYVGQCLRSNRIRKSFEDLARIYFDTYLKDANKVNVIHTKTGGTKNTEHQGDSVLMVVLRKDNVDFLTRIVRSLKGEITEV